MPAERSGAEDQGGSTDVSSARSESAETPLATRTFGSVEAAAGTVVGFYHLLQRIGQGGMGEVWLAEQKQPVRRRVAIKLIKAGMDTREVVARFESERQALALMDHPGIAKVFDAGSTPEGRPYFVMEYVPGLSITNYCDKHKMLPRQRLELFIRVCEGVQHAHQKAIIHRDLKPSNILVSELDGKPMPRIIDFGVAKATLQPLTAETMFTQLGAVVGTPGHMSPEQADRIGVDVDTRTDVYSLGVVLYELLVGVLPLDFHRLAFDEMLRRLREEDAPRPSTKLRTLGDQSSITAQNRGVDAPALVRQLRGDLDAIALKALEKDRTRRYATPSELAADIGRYLRHEPVLARPASTGYRARKYIRRHRIGVSLAAAAVLLVISFAVAQALELRRITRERDRANRITDFMKQMFKVSDPSEARGATITAREILDNASKGVDTGLARDPELQAQMMGVMGDVYESLGLYSRAQPLLERSAAISRRVFGPEAPVTLRSMSALAWTLQQQGRYLEAEKSLRNTLEAQRRVLGSENLDTVKTMKTLAWTLQRERHDAEAEKLEREAADVFRRVLGPDDRLTLVSVAELATALQNEGRYAEAEKLQRETLDAQRRVLGREHPDTLATINNLAATLMLEHRYSEAEKQFRDAVDIARHVLGPEHPDSLIMIANLAGILFSQGRYTEAESLQRKTLDIRHRVLGPEHPETLKAASDLAETVGLQGHYAEAEKALRETLSAQRRLVGPDHPDTANTTYSLACLEVRRGRRNEALSLLREAIDHGLPPDQALDIENDKLLASLHGDPRFAALVSYAHQRAATAQAHH